VGYLTALQAQGRVLVVEAGKDERLELSARNLPGVQVIRADSLNVVDILNADTLIITQPSLGTMTEVYA
jgi:large subunit ribosomal protein L4